MLAVQTDSTMLCQVTMQHGDEIVGAVCGMTLTAALAGGDPVSAGQTIGFAGKGAAGGAGYGAPPASARHAQGKAVDPTLLWK